MTAAFESPAVATLESSVTPVLEEAKSVTVADPIEYNAAAATLKSIRALRDQIAEVFDPICAKAFEAHKAATAQRKRFLDPVDEAERTVKRAMSVYVEAEDRRRLIAEAAAREVARKADEDARLARAAALEAAGAPEAADAVLEEAPPAPPVVAIPKPQAQGIRTSTTYSAEVTDLYALVCAVAKDRGLLHLVAPNAPALNAMARALRENLRVPGVRAIAVRGVSVRR